MRYWFFNGNDVVGPFTPKELAAESSFNAASLVCPETLSEKEDQWQPASSFAQLQPWITSEETDEAASLTLEEEMNTLLQEKSPLSFEKTTTDGPSLQLPKKPAAPGPIEDYFNHIQKEELGDILGIPAPAENSDMDLAHALEKQLAKTTSTRREEPVLNAADEQTVQQLQTAVATHHTATITEVFGAPAATVSQEPAHSPENSLPALPADDFMGMPTADTAPVVSTVPALAAPAEPEEPAPAMSAPAADWEEVTPAVQAPALAASVSTPAASDEPAEPADTVLPDPAQLRAEKVEVNSIKTHLKQTQEMKDVIQHTVAARPGLWERKATVGLLAVLVIIGSIFIIRQFPSRAAQAAPTAPAAPTTAARELLEPLPLAVPVPAAVAAPADRRQQALEIVQNYPLSGSRGTISRYLNRLYQTQLAQGYSGTWEAEPLHKNAYLVKYRLTKTRKEPIIYIFQADVDTGKLTGALNNISLDLVGKI